MNVYEVITNRIVEQLETEGKMRMNDGFRQHLKTAKDSADILDALKYCFLYEDIYNLYEAGIHEALVKSFELGYKQGAEQTKRNIRHALGIETEDEDS